jgi:hypothetical protein
LDFAGALRVDRLLAALFGNLSGTFLAMSVLARLR